MATIELCNTRKGSSAALRAYHGLVQWFDLFQRGQFGFYDAIYRESEAFNDWTVRTLPSDACASWCAALRWASCGAST